MGILNNTYLTWMGFFISGKGNKVARMECLDFEGPKMVSPNKGKKKHGTSNGPLRDPIRDEAYWPMDIEPNCFFYLYT